MDKKSENDQFFLEHTLTFRLDISAAASTVKSRVLNDPPNGSSAPAPPTVSPGDVSEARAEHVLLPLGASPNDEGSPLEAAVTACTHSGSASAISDEPAQKKKESKIGEGGRGGGGDGKHYQVCWAKDLFVGRMVVSARAEHLENNDLEVYTCRMFMCRPAQG